MNLHSLLVLTLVGLSLVEQAFLLEFREENYQSYSQQVSARNEEWDLLEPLIVPEPQDGGRWWYTPSRKAHYYSGAERFERRLKSFQKVQNRSHREDLRLPRHLIPTVLTIRLLPLFEEGNFTSHGHIDVFLDCVEDTSNITLNARHITVDQSSITVTNN